MTDTVLTRGSKWSADLLYDIPSAWRNTTDEQAAALGDLVVARFHDLARAADSTAHWTPATSEVIGDIDDPATEDQLDGWRVRAAAKVWAALLGESDNAALSRQVAAIFGQRFVVEAHKGADGTDRDLIIVHDLDLEKDGEARPGRIVVYADEVDGLIADIRHAARELTGDVPGVVWAVVHNIHVSTPHRHLVKLFVTGVPADVQEGEIQDRLAEAGYSFSEFGILWANHYIERLTEAEPEVKGVWNRHEGDRVTWEGITDFTYGDEVEDE